MTPSRTAESLPIRFRSPRRHEETPVPPEDPQAAYQVDSLAMRDSSLGDEEFGNFATHRDFAGLIPRTEIWISDRVIPQEGVFFIADALTRLQAIAQGEWDESAYVPASLYVEQYQTIPDEKFPVEVWLGDGSQVRSYYKTDYTEGGHGYVYPWVPRNQTWIESTLDRPERPFIVVHEYIVLRLMRDEKPEYDPAHEMCSRLEYKVRANQGLKPLLAPARRQLTKADLPRLAAPQVFEYVVDHCVKHLGCRNGSR